jgi:hypothetical protein
VIVIGRVLPAGQDMNFLRHPGRICNMWLFPCPMTAFQHIAKDKLFVFRVAQMNYFGLMSVDAFNTSQSKANDPGYQ